MSIKKPKAETLKRLDSQTISLELDEACTAENPRVLESQTISLELDEVNAPVSREEIKNWIASANKEPAERITPRHIKAIIPPSVSKEPTKVHNYLYENIFAAQLDKHIFLSKIPELNVETNKVIIDLFEELAFWNIEANIELPIEAIKSILEAYVWTQSLPKKILNQLPFPINFNNYPYLKGHSIRVSIYSCLISTLLNSVHKIRNSLLDQLAQKNPEIKRGKTINIREIALGSFFHDIGKFRPDLMELAKFPGVYNNEQRQLIEEHVTAGIECFVKLIEICQKENYPTPFNQKEANAILDIISGHHKKAGNLSGRSYPKDNKRPSLESLIVGHSDCFDAIVTRDHNNEKLEINKKLKRVYKIFNEDLLLKKPEEREFLNEIVNLMFVLNLRPIHYNTKDEIS